MSVAELLIIIVTVVKTKPLSIRENCPNRTLTGLLELNIFAYKPHKFLHAFLIQDTIRRLAELLQILNLIWGLKYQREQSSTHSHANNLSSMESGVFRLLGETNAGVLPSSIREAALKAV